jgi:Retrotransposon gag protein
MRPPRSALGKKKIKLGKWAFVKRMSTTKGSRRADGAGPSSENVPVPVPPEPRIEHMEEHNPEDNVANVGPGHMLQVQAVGGDITPTLSMGNASPMLLGAMVLGAPLVGEALPTEDDLLDAQIAAQELQLQQHAAARLALAEEIARNAQLQRQRKAERLAQLLQLGAAEATGMENMRRELAESQRQLLELPTMVAAVAAPAAVFAVTTPAPRVAIAHATQPLTAAPVTAVQPSNTETAGENDPMQEDETSMAEWRTSAPLARRAESLFQRFRAIQHDAGEPDDLLACLRLILQQLRDVQARAGEVANFPPYSTAQPSQNFLRLQEECGYAIVDVEAQITFLEGESTVKARRFAELLENAERTRLMAEQAQAALQAAGAPAAPFQPSASALRADRAAEHKRQRDAEEDRRQQQLVDAANAKKRAELHQIRARMRELQAELPPTVRGTISIGDTVPASSALPADAPAAPHPAGSTALRVPPLPVALGAIPARSGAVPVPVPEPVAAPTAGAPAPAAPSEKPNKYAEKPEKYTGAGNVDTAIYLLRKYFLNSNLPETKWADATFGHLGGKALDAWMDFAQPRELCAPLTWSDVCMVLRAAFPCLNVADAARNALHQLRQGNLTTANYLTEFTRCLSRMGTAVTCESDQIYLFQKGLNPDVQTLTRLDPATGSTWASFAALSTYALKITAPMPAVLAPKPPWQKQIPVKNSAMKVKGTKHKPAAAHAKQGGRGGRGRGHGGRGGRSGGRGRGVEEGEYGDPAPHFPGPPSTDGPKKYNNKYRRT